MLITEVDKWFFELTNMIGLQESISKVLQGISGNKIKSYGNEDTIEHIDLIIISDYCKGFLEESDIEYICENNFNVFVDTKKRLGHWIRQIFDFIKINELEYMKNHEVLDDGFEDKLIVTLGKKDVGIKVKNIKFHRYQ